MAQPFLKWVGGKRRMLAQYAPYFPREYRDYYEPFLGGGAVFFHLQARYPNRVAYLSDTNDDLVCAYRDVRDEIEKTIHDLNELEARYNAGHGEADYYQIRDRDPSTYNRYQRGTRLIYLNKTCRSGMWRESSHGHMNTPFGKYTQPKICDEQALLAAHQALQSVPIDRCDYHQSLYTAQRGDFVYLDPPYDECYNGYSPKGIFDQSELADYVHFLTKRGVLVMLSNSATVNVRKLYEGYTIVITQRSGAINSKHQQRHPVSELLILNYDPAACHVSSVNHLTTASAL